MNLKSEEIIYFLYRKLPKIIKGLYKGNLIFAYHGKFKNFGDQLTPVILDYYGFTTVFAHYNPKYWFSGKAKIVSVGTLLQGTPSDFDGIILGSGSTDIPLSFPSAEILGVRGKLTQLNLKMENKKLVLGDPGLLVSTIFPDIKIKSYKLGVIPHFFDKGDVIIEKYKKNFGNLVKIIDVQRDPLEVINDIKCCDNIISSSLHGLIVADSFGIPNIMYVIRSNIPPIHDHKYRDYYSAFNTELDLIEVDGTETIDFFLSKVRSHQELVSPVKLELHNLFTELKNYFKNHAT